MFIALLNLGAWIFVILAGAWICWIVLCVPFWIVAKIVMKTPWYKRREEQKRRAETLLYVEQYKNRHSFY